MQLIETPEAEETREYRMLVGGEWVDALSGNTLESIDPYTDKVWATAPEAGRRAWTGGDLPDSMASLLWAIFR